MKNYKLPNGLIVDGQSIKEVSMAETGGEAELIFNEKPTSSGLYTWFGKVVSVAVKSIGEVKVASEFLKDEDRAVVPIVTKIPFVDIGTLLIQIQRECWEDTIKEQQIVCSKCGTELTADIELEKIEIPFDENIAVPENIVVSLGREYKIDTGIEALASYDGEVYDHLVFRVPLLADAIRHEKIAQNDLQFWRNIAFDCLVGMFKLDEAGNRQYTTDGYAGKRGKMLFNKDWDSKTLKKIRDGLQKGLPSPKFYYEDKCSACGKQTPYFTDITNFFS